MPAPSGNQFWLQRSTHGREKIMASPDVMWAAALEYFQWVEDNPLYECKVFHYQGETTKTDVPVMRAMTLEGLATFMGMSSRTLRDYRSRDDYSPVMDLIDDIIRRQKFEGAAANLLNANIIARDLGLSDKVDNTHDVPEGSPMASLLAAVTGKTLRPVD